MPNLYELATVVPSAARTTSGSTGPLTGYAGADFIRAQVNVTAVSGTTPSMTAVVEDSVDNGTTWNTLGSFAAKTAVAREVINITVPFTDMVRVSWTITGTTPSLTFDVNIYSE